GFEEDWADACGANPPSPSSSARQTSRGAASLKKVRIDGNDGKRYLFSHQQGIAPCSFVSTHERSGRLPPKQAGVEPISCNAYYRLATQQHAVKNRNQACRLFMEEGFKVILPTVCRPPIL